MWCWWRGLCCPFVLWAGPSPAAARTGAAAAARDRGRRFELEQWFVLTTGTLATDQFISKEAGRSSGSNGPRSRCRSKRTQPPLGQARSLAGNKTNLVSFLSPAGRPLTANRPQPADGPAAAICRPSSGRGGGGRVGPHASFWRGTDTDRLARRSRPSVRTQIEPHLARPAISLAGRHRLCLAWLCRVETNKLD